MRRRWKRFVCRLGWSWFPAYLPWLSGIHSHGPSATRGDTAEQLPPCSPAAPVIAANAGELAVVRLQGQAVITTAMTEMVGCTVPIQQAPMPAVATPKLARAVADAGGLGTLTAFGRTPEELANILDTTRAGTAGALAANFITDNMDPAGIEVAASRVRVVDFFWTTPDASVVELAHAGGALACWQVGSIREAQAAADAGCDLIAVQGTEAGGHIRGELPLLPLLSAVLDAVPVPVLAGGGIGTARGLAAVLAAGAAGARIGTRFIATEESGAHPRYKQAILAARAGETEITGAFSVMCPLCAQQPRVRVLSSALSAAAALDDDTAGEMKMAGQHIPLPKFAGLPPHLEVSGHIEAMALYAGDSVEGATQQMPAAQVIHELTGGAQQLLHTCSAACSNGPH
jgi:nitronate monooxygenase